MRMKIYRELISNRSLVANPKDFDYGSNDGKTNGIVNGLHEDEDIESSSDDGIQETSDLPSKMQGWKRKVMYSALVGVFCVASAGVLIFAASSDSKSSVIKYDAQIFFLFLTIQGVQRPDLWQAFFEGADTKLYRSFVHCKDYEFCKANLNYPKYPLDMTLVETVTNLYCKDLVTSMVQLLRVSLVESRSPGDKFVFLSETTLPVKPFWQVRSVLLEDEQSDFCVSRVNKWVQLKGSFGNSSKALLVKHSQWVILNQNHSRIMVGRWPAVSEGPAWSVPVHGMGGASEGDDAFDITNAHKLHTGVGGLCADEWVIFATIYGAIIEDGQQQEEHLHGFANAPLRLTGSQGHPWESPQGRCRTFAAWGTTSKFGKTGLLREQLKDSPHTVLHFSLAKSPAVFKAVSEEGASMLRQSSFLFARKFESHAMTDAVFKQVILNKNATQ